MYSFATTIFKCQTVRDLGKSFPKLEFLILKLRYRWGTMDKILTIAGSWLICVLNLGWMIGNLCWCFDKPLIASFFNKVKGFKEVLLKSAVRSMPWRDTPLSRECPTVTLKLFRDVHLPSRRGHQWWLYWHCSLKAEDSIRSGWVYILFIMCTFWRHGNMICLNDRKWFCI